MNVRAAARRAAPPTLGLVVVYLLLVVTPLGRRLDEAATYGHFQTGWWVRRFDDALLSSMSSAGALTVVLAVVLIASLRGRWQRGARVAVAVIGSAVCAEVLKLVLPSYRWYQQGWEVGGSYPSGHTAVAAALALAVLSVSSQRWRRWLIAPAVAGVILTATATVTMNWHRPSDVFGGLLLALAWHRACTVGEPERRVRSTWVGPGGLAASFVSLVVVGLAVRGVLVASDLRLPPWVPVPMDGGTGIVYVASLAAICVATAATLLGARYPVSAPAGPAAGEVGSDLGSDPGPGAASDPERDRQVGSTLRA